MKHRDPRYGLTDSLEKRWMVYFEEASTIASLLIAVRANQAAFLQDATNDAATLTEESFRDTKSSFGPSILVKMARMRPHFVERFPTVINRLSLIMVVTCFEVFLKGSISAVLRVKPELISQVFNRKVDSLGAQMGAIKPFPKMLEFLKSCKGGSGLNIDLNNPYFQEHQLLEIHETRHILVHNIGIIDKKYRDHVKDTPFNVGEERPLSDDYVMDSINALNRAATYLAVTFQEKFCDVII